MWQDYALSLTGFVFIVSLLPSIFSKDKPAFTTSLITCSGIAVNMVAFATLKLWWTFITNVILFCLWATLGMQMLLKGKIKPE
jgi:hypothetical protein